MPTKRTPMLTRIPVSVRESLKAFAADPEYGSLRNMCDQLFEQFIKEKPYKNRAFSWVQPAKRGTTNWIAYNVVVSDEISIRVKFESARLEVSLTTLLYTALVWWIDSKKLPTEKGI